MSKLKPNFTQIPNIFLDELMYKLTDSQLKVALYIMRRTYGFQKLGDKISTSQICNGIVDRNGDRLDYGTGLSNRSVIDAIRHLIEIGLITGTSTNGKTRYFRISSEEVSQAEPMKKVHSTYEESSQEPMKKVHTQKKGKESIQNKDTATKLRVDSIIDSFKVVNPNYKSWFPNTTQRKACHSLLELMDLDKLVQLIKKVLPATNKRQYAPTITTPLQLLEKFAQLESYLQKEKSNSNKNVIL